MKMSAGKFQSQQEMLLGQDMNLFIAINHDEMEWKDDSDEED